MAVAGLEQVHPMRLGVFFVFSWQDNLVYSGFSDLTSLALKLGSLFD